MEKASVQRTAIASVLLSLFIVIFVLIFASHRTINAALYDLGLIPAGELFTELYFEDHTNLPKQIITGEPIPFAFTIRNLEGRATTYAYLVYFNSPSGHWFLLDNGTMSLEDDASTTIRTSPIIPTDDTSGKIVVKLYATHSQSIAFILPNTNP